MLMEKREKKSYYIKQLRIGNETWEDFKRNKQKSGLTWNLFIKQLNERIKNDG